MGKGASCGGCHNGKAAFGVDKCSRCHPVREIRYSLAGAGKVTFSHQRHLLYISILFPARRAVLSGHFDVFCLHLIFRTHHIGEGQSRAGDNANRSFVILIDQHSSYALGIHLL